MQQPTRGVSAAGKCSFFIMLPAHRQSMVKSDHVEEIVSQNMQNMLQEIVQWSG